ncbi:MAG TPA: cupin domain-containing protein [Deltaproteobacteria bacterium]|nr:cupin domain-containing protein [Deltaproteobacteria bacterium]
MIAHHFLEIEELTGLDQTRGVGMRILIGKDHGADRFIMRRFSVDPGGFTPRHTHPWEHEIYILSGSGVIHVGHEHAEVSEGTAVFIPPGAEHQILAGESHLEFLCLIPHVEEA